MAEDSPAPRMLQKAGSHPQFMGRAFDAPPPNYLEQGICKQRSHALALLAATSTSLPVFHPARIRSSNTRTT